MGKDAKAAAKQIKKGSHANLKRKVWTNTTFRRPVTKTQRQAPIALRRGVKNDRNVFNPFAIIKHPLSSESAIKTIEDHNTLVFICDRRAKKATIKKAVEALYQPIKVSRVNTLMRPDGEKKAYVTLGADQDALEAASRIGIM